MRATTVRLAVLLYAESCSAFQVQARAPNRAVARCGPQSPRMDMSLPDVGTIVTGSLPLLALPVAVVAANAAVSAFANTGTDPAQDRKMAEARRFEKERKQATAAQKATSGPGPLEGLLGALPPLPKVRFG